MTIEDIIKQVRWCVDKEAQNESSMESYTKDDSFIDNMIKAHVGDALFWCGYYGSSQLLNGSSDSTYGVLKSYTISTSPTTDTNLQVVAKENNLYGEIELPSDYVKLVRVRMDGWYKSVSENTQIAEDSDEYVELRDEIAEATSKLPRACVINSYPKKLEVYPYNTGGEITIAVNPTTKEGGDWELSDEVDIPVTIRTGFIYYLAFLLLSALSDGNANTMLEIAKMNIGLQESNS